MARFGKFMKDQLSPEDPVDWVILLIVVGVTITMFVVLFAMFSQGLI